ncbi:MAG: DUF285 domain-containing protein [Nanoarchaeota archaeon]|nr:DUF285 domain-containing protein [Nanoarchaeota archaeon]
MNTNLLFNLLNFRNSKRGFSEAVVVLVLFSSLSVIGIVMFTNYQSSVALTQEQLSQSYTTLLENRNLNFEILETQYEDIYLNIRIRNSGSTQLLTSEFSFFINSNFITFSNIEFLDIHNSPLQVQLIQPFQEFRVQIMIEDLLDLNVLSIIHDSGVEKQREFEISRETIFISIWDTTLTSSGSTNDTTIQLPLTQTGVYDFRIDWGDGTIEEITQWDEAIHTYEISGVYTIEIDGVIEGFRFNDQGDRLKLLIIEQWGNLRVGDEGNYFHGAENFNSNAIDSLNVSGMTNFRDFFRNAREYDEDISSWDVSLVEVMWDMFRDARNFNNGGLSGINNWDVSNVENMRGLFYDAQSFNQPLNNWDVSNVENMRDMFRRTFSFNQPLDNWNVSNVRDMDNMFFLANVFNQNLNMWNTSSVERMNSMFRSASSFFQPIGDWDTSLVITMDRMFRDASSFNQDLSCWNVTLLNEPLEFSVNSPLSFQNTPIWETDGGGGTCNVIIPTAHFISQWNTSLGDGGLSITLPLEESGFYDFTVFWGDGNQDIITSWNQVEVTHTYSSHDIYTIELVGVINGFNFANGISLDVEKIINIEQWGNISLGNNGGYFSGAVNLESTATDSPDLGSTTIFSEMFLNAQNFNGDVSGWDMSTAVNMQDMFRGAHSFNQPLNLWDVSGVLNMRGLFFEALSFNQDLEFWNTSSVTNMIFMFRDAQSFNGNISTWDVSEINNFNSMFRGASSFNQPLNSWNVSNVIRMSNMFYDAQEFNQNLDLWDTSSVQFMDSMFRGAQSFNNNISTWDVNNVQTMANMFIFAQDFNSDISSWNTSSLSNMNGIFRGTSFNQDISNWDISGVSTFTDVFRDSPFNLDISSWNTSGVVSMIRTFQDAQDFNQSLNTWDVSNVENMQDMFRNAQSFNQDIGNWDTSQVTNMIRMFRDTLSFNQDLTCWNVTLIPSLPSGFTQNSALDISNRPTWGTDGSSC